MKMYKNKNILMIEYTFDKPYTVFKKNVKVYKRIFSIKNYVGLDRFS